MGWAVLYIAFGIVALWLLGEVLLQNKARLRWRLLAFTGFLGVVAGVLLASVIVIGVGAAAFAVGQTYVTLSYRRGFTAGWVIRNKRGAAGRRPARPEAEPVPEAGGPAPAPGPEQPPLPTYQPEPMPDDTGGYAAYRSPEPAPEPEPEPGYDAFTTSQAGYGGYGGYDAYGYSQTPGEHGDQGAGQDFGAAPGPAPVPDGGHPYGTPGYATADHGYGEAGIYRDADPYGAAQQPYPGYDQQAYDVYGQPQYGTAADDHYAAQDGYAAPGYVQQPYPAAQPYPVGPEDTPPGGVWVPQQRDGDVPAAPPEQPPHYPYQQEPGPSGYDGQYRY